MAGVRFAAAGRSDRGRVRPTNEDSFVVWLAAAGTAALCIVADGMGGCNAGEIASGMAVDRIEADVLSWLSAAGSGSGGGFDLVEDGPEALAGAVLNANRQIYESGKQEPDRAGMGTTVTAALFAADYISLAHVGDSRAFLIRDGEITQVTSDHSVVGELLRNGSLTEKEAERHPHRNVLTRALGTDPVVSVDLWQQPLAPGDVVVICSDGITRHVDGQELAGLVKQTGQPGAAAASIVDLANTRGGIDNLTAVVIIVGCCDS